MFLEDNLSFCVPYLFILCDIVGGYLLMKGAKHFVEKQIRYQTLIKHRPDVETLLWVKEDLHHIPYFVGLLYLFNPFSLVTYGASSTVLINNFLTCIVLFFLVKGYEKCATVVLALACYLSFYPIMLLIPIALSHTEDGSKISWRKVTSIVSVFLMMSCVLLLCSFKVFESWDFINAVYFFILKVPDLTPNMGLFWYFFLEMFEHFRLFFLWVLQLHTFVYLIPFVVLFRNQPIFLCYCLIATCSWCKSYSSVGDVIIPLAILPLWRNITPYFRSLFVAIVMLLFSAILAPVLYHLWVYAGSGNANFFYAATLAFNLAQILLLSDVVYAYLRRKFHLKHGLNPLTEDKEEGVIVMK
ncbi:phosphatidylinositol glycan anchor biosynthesis class U protein-like isoform X2 [Rhopilema esculentum]